MDRDAFAARLAEGPILSDGGMGTALIDLGAPVGACFELLNVDDPARVSAVHGAYVDAGSALVLTNTFGANRFRLERHGLAHRVAELNAAGVEIARRTGVLVAGSAGPLGVRLAPYGRVRPEEAFGAYAEQLAALADAGVDLILVETQTDLSEMEQALAAAREVCDLPVVVSATFTLDDRTLLGSTPEAVAARLSELGADAIGVNCGEGPAQGLRLARAMRPHIGDVQLVVRPNAGGPQQVGGRFVYPATPEYVADHSLALLEEGVAVIGGCCGIGAEHTRAIAAMLDHGTTTVLVRPTAVDATAAIATRTAAAPTELERTLEARRFVIAVEMEPPRSFNAATLLAAAETLRDAGADVIDVADSPMAKMRMSPWAACRLIQEQSGIETVLHFPTRGRNLLRLQGDLLAVHALGIRNVFVCLGDPVTVGEYPQGSNNVDVTATGLIELVTGEFNRGRDRAGSSIGEPTSFVVGAAVNPSAPDLEREVRLLHRKVEAGARFLLSQPVYGVEPLQRLAEAYQRVSGATLEIPILAGVLPLLSGRHAEFLHNEVPGIHIPERIRDRMRKAGDRSEREGLAMAGELVAAIGDIAAGIYLMPQFGRYDLAAELVESARAHP